MFDDKSPKTYCVMGTNPKTMLPLVKKFLREVFQAGSFFYTQYQGY